MDLISVSLKKNKKNGYIRHYVFMYILSNKTKLCLYYYKIPFFYVKDCGKCRISATFSRELMYCTRYILYLVDRVVPDGNVIGRRT